MNIYQSNTYRKGFSCLHFNDEPRVQEKQLVKDQQSCIFVFVVYLKILSSNKGTSPDMATVFHAWPYCRFIEILSNLRRKKLLKRNQGSNFLEGNFSNSNNVRALIQPRKEVNTSIIKDDFSSKTDPSIFASLEPLLSHQSSKTS